MGGHNAGEVAARLAVDAIRDYVAAAQDRSAPAALLRAAIDGAHAQILETARRSAACCGMGTTIVAALAAGDRLAVGHAGDSRLYLANRRRGLKRLTDDDV